MRRERGVRRTSTSPECELLFVSEPLHHHNYKNLVCIQCFIMMLDLNPYLLSCLGTSSAGRVPRCGVEFCGL